MRLNLLRVLNENFRIKIFFLAALLIFVMCFSFTSFILHRETKSLTDALIEKGNLLAGVLAFDSRIGIFSENQELLEVAAEGILQQDGLLDVSIFNLEGKLLKSKEKPETRSLEESMRRDAGSRRKIMEKITKTGLPFHRVGNSVVEFWSPVISYSTSVEETSLLFKGDLLKRKARIIGFTMITADKRILNREINDLLFKTIIIGIAFLISGFVVAYIVVTGITKPLNKLIESVKIFGTAGTVEKVPVETEDEIGALAMAFNNMAESLIKRESALRESEEKYRVLASTTDLMYLVDRDCRYLFLNDAYMKRVGFVKELVIGRHYSDFHNEASSGIFRNCIRQACETVRPYQYGHVSVRDGRHFLRTVTPVLDTHGEITAITVVSKDITEQKRKEDELRKALHDLQETKGRLIQADKLAALGQLSAGVAHEILNPVNIISMRLQLMETIEAVSEKVKESLQICKDQVLRITRITRGISEFAHISATHYADGDVNQLINHVISLEDGRLKIENVETLIRYEPELPPIEIDKDRMEQVILNLVNNAIDAMRNKREKKLCISTTFKDKQIVISVSDTGTGIAPEILNKIFDPFFTTKQQGQGTGLGLAISYGIVRDHGGKIWAENNEMEGVSFFIALPTCHREGIN